MICACLGLTLTIELWTCDGDVWIKAEPVVNEGKSTCHTPEHTGSLAVSWTPSLARLWQKCNLSKKAWQDGQTRNARDHNRSISGLGTGQCCEGWRHKEVTVHHRAALSPVLRSHPLSLAACRQVQWLPGASPPLTHLTHLQPTPSLPISILNIQDAFSSSSSLCLSCCCTGP